jgi:hypothetical protein
MTNEGQHKIDVSDLRIDVLNLQPGDIVAIRSLRRITMDNAAQIQEMAKEVFGDRPILVLPPDFEIMVVRYPLDESE